MLPEGEQLPGTPRHLIPIMAIVVIVRQFASHIVCFQLRRPQLVHNLVHRRRPPLLQLHLRSDQSLDDQHRCSKCKELFLHSIETKSTSSFRIAASAFAFCRFSQAVILASSLCHLNIKTTTTTIIIIIEEEKKK